jgi:diguanylate cyclase (GGDEF)-like protein
MAINRDFLRRRGAALPLAVLAIGVRALARLRACARRSAHAMSNTLRPAPRRRDATPAAPATLLALERDIARGLADAIDGDAMLARTLEAVCTRLGWDCAAVWRVGEEGTVTCRSAWHVEGAAMLEQFVRISASLCYRPDEGSLGRAWAIDRAVTVDTSPAPDRFTRDAMAGQAGLATGLVVPLVAVGQKIALELFSRAPRETDEDDIASLRAIALQLAQHEQRRQAEHALRYAAGHDALTGLSNRTTLQWDLARAIKRSHRQQKHFAVMFVDLDRFKRINDTLGHGIGDLLLKACGERLVGVLREDDAVARFGGDEFVLVVENLSEAGDAIVVAEKVLACCAEPFAVDGGELHLTASIGVSVYPEDGADGEALLKNADTAMYRAKDQGGATHRFYAAQMNEQAAERLTLENGLRGAVARDEFVLHYQPKMDLRTQRIVGVEALMRWNHPVLGLMAPARFIPMAEENGLIVEMGRWALQTACDDVRDWQRRGLPPVQVSVNLSPRQLVDDSIVDDVAVALHRSGLNPELLELEITESAMMKSPDAAAALLQQIRRLGVGLAIDDFGTGYSSLSYLKRFPLTAVKIDRCFVHDLSRDPQTQGLTDGIVTLAHGLHMKVIAEGVETAEQMEVLRERGCDEIQGYWLCKPVPAEEACRFMARHLRSTCAAPVAA